MPSSVQPLLVREDLVHLNGLISFCYRTVGTYQAAIRRIADPSRRDQLAQGLATHQRYLARLRGRVLARGATPASSRTFDSTAKGQLLVRGAVCERSVLSAVLSAERDTAGRLDDALVSSFSTAEGKGLIEQYLRSVHAHQHQLTEWLEQRADLPARP